jgi:hypothetical protein
MSDAALAYVGPGAGLSLLGALWGLLAAVGAALAFVILWPLRQLLKRMRAKRAAAAAETQESQAMPRTTEQSSEELRRRAP